MVEIAGSHGNEVLRRLEDEQVPFRIVETERRDVFAIVERPDSSEVISLNREVLILSESGPMPDNGHGWPFQDSETTDGLNGEEQDVFGPQNPDPDDVILWQPGLFPDRDYSDNWEGEPGNIDDFSDVIPIPPTTDTPVTIQPIGDLPVADPIQPSLPQPEPQDAAPVESVEERRNRKAEEGRALKAKNQKRHRRRGGR